ncbi:MAG: hypothetical protein WB807_03650 [Candidatus Dormiibacterota bacterium]
MPGNRFLALNFALAAIALGGCSASTTSGTPTSAATSTPTPIPTPRPTAGPTPPPDLSGTWTGQYSGPFNGTFALRWTQNGSALSGSIALSSPRDNLQISGNVTGSSISFGAVGVVTYTGTVSGFFNMSGSYTDIANGHAGSWSATKVPTTD